MDRCVELGEPFGDLESVHVRQLDVEENEIGSVLLRLCDAADAGVGLGDDDEFVALEKLTRGSPEVSVVVDDENAARDEAIVPAQGAMRSVAGPTLCSAR